MRIIEGFNPLLSGSVFLTKKDVWKFIPKKFCVSIPSLAGQFF